MPRADGESVNLSIFQDQEKLPPQVSEALARHPVDYQAQTAFMEKHKNGPTPWEGGGVLLPLFYQTSRRPKDTPGDFVFLLNKRAPNLPQGGDLCAPGGGDHPLLDAGAGRILDSGIFPSLQSPALQKAKERGEEGYRTILYYWSNALRESWEEIRLSAFNVDFLGPLPAYRLQSRRWIIFPLAGQVREKWLSRPSPEVEKIVPIPLAAFYHPGNYGLYSLQITEEMAAGGLPNPWVFPCLLAESGGEEEILWGATFQILRNFLKIVFPFPLPVPAGDRVVRRPLRGTYLSGESS